MNNIGINLAIKKRYDEFNKSYSNLLYSAIEGIKCLLEDIEGKSYNLRENGISIIAHTNYEITIVESIMLDDDEIIVLHGDGSKINSSELPAEVWYSIYDGMFNHLITEE